MPHTKKLGATSLKELEERLVQLIISAPAMAVVAACVECLASCIERTKNFDLATLTLQRFYTYVTAKRIPRLPRASTAAIRP